MRVAVVQHNDSDRVIKVATDRDAAAEWVERSEWDDSQVYTVTRQVFEA